MHQMIAFNPVLKYGSQRAILKSPKEWNPPYAS